MSSNQKISVYPITIYVKAKSKEDAMQCNAEMKDFYEFDTLMLRAIRNLAKTDPQTFRGVIKKALNGDTAGAISAIAEKAASGFSMKKLLGKK